MRSFYDSDGDGVGDLRGLTEKLDYINDGDAASHTDLGASCIWLLPVSPSPSYHGYDVTNYFEVNREYGTIADFQRLTAEAHRRGIRVLIDLVLNHMSSEHPYFQSALLDRASPYRDWFIWSPIQRQTRGWGGATWHKVPSRDEYYYGLFWAGMPDLNLANPAVTAEAQRIARFWLRDMGADGFRFDAVGHFFEQGDDPRNGPEVHPWLRDYVTFIRGIKTDAFTVGEVWDSVGAIRPYYPDQLEAYFAFPLADALVDAVRSGSGRTLLDVLARVQREYPPGRWASFQRNHDQTRTLTEFHGDVARARLSATLLLTLPGIPFIYYGEEIGMTGTKPDPRLRTPMQWAPTTGVGFTTGMPWAPLQPDSFTTTVAAQDRDPASLLNLYRRLVHLREGRPALGAGAEFIALGSGSDSVLAFARRANGQVVVVVANLTGTRRPGPALTSTGAVVAAGRYTPRALLGPESGSPLRVSRDGWIRAWAPVTTLEPFEARIMELAPRQ